MSPRTEIQVGQFAEGQWGVVARRQLLELGLSVQSVERWLASGRLVRLHRGVYALGHRRLRREAFWMAATLAGGPGAVLSHRSSGALQGLSRRDPAKPDVTVPRSRRGVPTISVHRPRELDPVDVTSVHGVPTTTVHRTLVDLAEVARPEELRAAAEQALILRAFDARALQDAMVRAGRKQGVQAIRRLLADHTLDAVVTRSAFERRFRAFLERHEYPRPRFNAHVPLADGSLAEVDFLWPEQEVVVELDGYATHGTRDGFERDRRRDSQLRLIGFDVHRITWRRLEEDEPGVRAILDHYLRPP